MIMVPFAKELRASKVLTVLCSELIQVRDPDIHLYATGKDPMIPKQEVS